MVSFCCCVHVGVAGEILGKVTVSRKSLLCNGLRRLIRAFVRCCERSPYS